MISNKNQVPPFDLKNDLKKFGPIAITNTLSVIMALYSLKIMNIAVLDTVKRCGPIANLVLRLFILSPWFKEIDKKKLENEMVEKFGAKVEPDGPEAKTFLEFKKRQQKFEFLSVGLATCGASFSVFSDHAHSNFIYFISIISVILQSSYQSLVELSGIKNNTSSTEILYKVAICSIPIIPFISLLFEQSELSKFLEDYNNGTLRIFLVLPYLLLQAGAGALLNKVMYECAIVNSAVTTSLIGLMKSTLSSIVGLFSFGGMNVTINFVVGLVINIVGSGLFVYVKNFWRGFESVEKEGYRRLSQSNEEV